MVNPGPNPLNLAAWSHDMVNYRPIPGYMDLELNQEGSFTAGTGSSTYPADHPMVPRMMQASQDVVPITAHNGAGWSWSGTIADYEAGGRPGRETVTFNLVESKDMLNIPAWPNTRSSLAMQGKRDYQINRLRTVATHFLAENLARQEGLPCYIMQPPPPHVDKSPIVDVAAKMTALPELLGPVLDEHDYFLSCEMWWPGQPFPDGKMIPLVDNSVFQRQAMVTRCNLNLRVNPMGPRVAEPTVPGLLIQVRPVRERPHVRFSTNGRDVQEFRLTGRKPGAASQTVGGKSDDWVNELLNLGVDASIQGILIALGSAAGPAGGVIGGIIGNIITDQLTDTLFAYTQRTDVERLARMGPFAPREEFTSSSAGAFTFDTSALAERRLVETAGGQSIEIAIADGISKVMGDDQIADNGKTRHGWRIGDRVTFEEHLSGAVVSDIITGVTVTDRPGERVRITPKVGKARNRSNGFLDFTNLLGKILSTQTDFGLS